jgi:ABC-type Mn2+/Zn2+ transport system permease subunit
MLAVALGLFLSVSFDMPGGPSIVLVLGVLFAASIIPAITRQRR